MLRPQGESVTAGLPGGAAGAASSRWGKASLAVLLLCHLLLTWHFLPLTQLAEPYVSSIDFPMHTHNAQVFRDAVRESGWWWGYDPAVCAGVFINPAQTTSRPQEILCTLLPFLSAGQAVTLFSFLGVLLMPVWVYLACRMLGMGAVAIRWTIFLFILSVWFTNGFWSMLVIGMVAFPGAVAFSVVVLACLHRFLARPSVKGLLIFWVSGSLLFLGHLAGPIGILPALILLPLTAPKVAAKWRLAAFGAMGGMILVNLFWLAPMVLGLTGPRPPWARRTALETNFFWTFANWGELGRHLDGARLATYLVEIVLVIGGTLVVRRQVGKALAIGLLASWVFCLLVNLFGSFVPGLRVLQPLRFVVAERTLACVMVGWALASVVRWPRIVQPALAALMAVATLAAIHLGRAPSVSPAPAALQLADFIRQQTAPADRIAVEVSAEPFGGVHGDCSMKPLADLVGREVIGNPDPDFADPVRFDLHGLLGIPFGEVGRVEAALKRWGVSWVFCRSEDAARCLESIAGGEGVRVGQYRAFRLPWTADRFLVGAGQVLARVNRIELTDLRPANGWVVVKYRYHPGWRVSGGLAVQRYPVAEDRTGFIALHDPPAKVTLTFDSWDALRKNWPEQADSPQIPQISQIESKSPQRNSLTLSQCRMTNSE